MCVSIQIHVLDVLQLLIYYHVFWLKISTCTLNSFYPGPLPPPSKKKKKKQEKKERKNPPK